MSRKQSSSKKRLRIFTVDTSSSDGEVDNEEIFEVEAILDKRLVNGQVSVCVCVCKHFLRFIF